jgi:hypothetical protein
MNVMDNIVGAAATIIEKVKGDPQRFVDFGASVLKHPDAVQGGVDVQETAPCATTGQCQKTNPLQR